MKNTDFSFDHNKGVGMPGNYPIYNTFSFDLANFKGVTTADYYLTLPLAMARLGGFIFGWVFLTYVVLYGWNYFNANMVMIKAMYTFTKNNGEGNDPR